MSGLDLDALVKEAHASNDYDALLKMVPYARLIGIECLRLGDEMVLYGNDHGFCAACCIEF